MNIPEKELVILARQARARSYSPYSRFAVGAAVFSSDGNISPGSNVENASYGLAICAERVAIFRAITEGARKISAIAVSCPQEKDKPSSLMPCGACLQVISEFADGDIPIIVDGVGNFLLSELLPRPFQL